MTMWQARDEMPTGAVTPVLVSDYGAANLRPGDIVADLNKRDLDPRGSWQYTLTAYLPDNSRIAMAKGYSHSWHAIYGPGTAGGHFTTIGPRRLLGYWRIANVYDMPFLVTDPPGRERKEPWAFTVDRLLPMIPLEQQDDYTALRALIFEKDKKITHMAASKLAAELIVDHGFGRIHPLGGDTRGGVSE